MPTVHEHYKLWNGYYKLAITTQQHANQLHIISPLPEICLQPSGTTADARLLLPSLLLLQKITYR